MNFIEGEIIEDFIVDIEGERKNIVFRRVKKSDAAGKYAFKGSLLKEGAYLSALKRTTIEDEQKHIDSLIERSRNGHAAYIIIEADSRFCGYCIIEKGVVDFKHTGEIGIALIQEYRNLGIAERAMKSAEEYAKSKMNITLLRLEYYSSNKPAEKLYHKLGYKSVGVIPNMYKREDGSCYDGIFMYKELK